MSSGRAVLALAVAALVLVGCGDDDTGTAPPVDPVTELECGTPGELKAVNAARAREMPVVAFVSGPIRPGRGGSITLERAVRDEPRVRLDDGTEADADLAAMVLEASVSMVEGEAMPPSDSLQVPTPPESAGSGADPSVVYRVASVLEGTWTATRCEDDGAAVDLRGRYTDVESLQPVTVEACDGDHAESLEQQAADLGCR